MFTIIKKLICIDKNGLSENCERQPLKNFTWSILEYLNPILTNIFNEMQEYYFFKTELLFSYVINVNFEDKMDMIQ